ncbi:hypothetical protein K456DRAFT_175900 [Colletotrichum gloeosporioides 23]|nr:hypothetical protein K456DRAFT_175900 [Colletotrichum gloeosporioides 23]
MCHDRNSPAGLYFGHDKWPTWKMDYDYQCREPVRHISPTKYGTTRIDESTGTGSLDAKDAVGPGISNLTSARVPHQGNKRIVGDEIKAKERPKMSAPRPRLGDGALMVRWSNGCARRYFGILITRWTLYAPRRRKTKVEGFWVVIPRAAFPRTGRYGQQRVYGHGKRERDCWSFQWEETAGTTTVYHIRERDQRHHLSSRCRCLRA